MTRGRQILTPERFQITLRRLAHEILENYSLEASINIIGIQEKGVVMTERLIGILKEKGIRKPINFGKLDITFYRDDFRIREKPLKANATEINFDIEGQKVLLVDDVLYTGRTIHAAMSALQDIGRVDKIEMMAMVDRRFNRHFPIACDYTGIQVDSLDEAYVAVQWQHIDKQDQILIFSAQKKISK